MADINVNVTRATGGVTQAGFGTALILDSTVKDFSIYKDLASLSGDFATDTKVYEMAAALMGQEITPTQFAVAGADYEAGVDSASVLTDLLNTLVADGKDFYLVLQTSDDVEAQEAVSAWTAAQTKLHFIRVSDLPSVYTGTLGDNTAVYYTTQVDEYPDAAVAGYGLPRLPGSLTWKNIVISGITNEVLTGTEEAELAEAGFNYIRKYYGRNVTSNGLLQGGLFIDQRRSQDFVELRTEENIANLLISNDKIPYDDKGIAQVVSVVEKSLNEAFRNGIIASNEGGQALYTVNSVPRVDIPQEDIDSRILKTVTFEYEEAGAIEGATINGTIVAQLGV